MALHILVPKHPLRIYLLQYAHEVIKARVEQSKVVRAKTVGFCPVWAAIMPSQDGLKMRKELLIGYCQAIGSGDWWVGGLAESRVR